MKKYSSILLVALLGASLFAKNISIQIVQNNPAAQDSVCSSSSLIEQTIIDYFFGTGHIVSNSPVYVVSKDSVGDEGLKDALAENAQGGMDYLVRVEVDFKTPKDTNNPDAILLENIDKVTWKNYAVKTGLQLNGGSEKIGTVNRQNNNEDGVSSFANLIALKINASLNGR